MRDGRSFDKTDAVVGEELILVYRQRLEATDLSEDHLVNIVVLVLHNSLLL